MIRLTLISALMGVMLAPGAALAGQYLGNGGIATVPMPKRIVAQEEHIASPTYADAVAQRLGIKNGKMDLFEIGPSQPRDSMMPTVSGSLGGNGAMLKLKWRP